MAYTTIDNPELYFQTKLWTGNGSAQALTFDGSEDMQPDMVWMKPRSFDDNHILVDSVRGTNKIIRPNTHIAESTLTTMLTAFGSDGFTTGDNDNVARSSATFVAWCWKESATAGFDIVSYNGTGNDATANISHSLSAVPEFMWIKCRTSAKNNTNYHVSLGNTKSFYIDETNAASTSYDYWADTTPTSSVFTVKDDSSYDEVNAASDQTFIAYLWSGKQGFSKFGKYLGNGSSTDNSFVFLGFSPSLLIIKADGSSNSWQIFDNKRDGYNPDNNRLYSDSSTTESTTDVIDLLSNGFKVRDSNTWLGSSGASFTYMAWAHAPFVNSKGVPANAR
jgi:hypothetical protein